MVTRWQDVTAARRGGTPAGPALVPAAVLLLGMAVGTAWGSRAAGLPLCDHPDDEVCASFAGDCQNFDVRLQCPATCGVCRRLAAPPMTVQAQTAAPATAVSRPACGALPDPAACAMFATTDDCETNSYVQSTCPATCRTCPSPAVTTSATAATITTSVQTDSTAVPCHPPDPDDAVCSLFAWNCTVAGVQQTCPNLCDVQCRPTPPVLVTATYGATDTPSAVRVTIATTTAPSAAPTHLPTTTILSGAPTASPSFDRTNLPTVPSSSAPMWHPSRLPTPAPTLPTDSPVEAPADVRTVSPSHAPTRIPSPAPSPGPTSARTAAPTELPTDRPTFFPTRVPTQAPILSPTPSPSPVPMSSLTTPAITEPSLWPTTVLVAPTTAGPSEAPTALPTVAAAVATTAAGVTAKDLSILLSLVIVIFGLGVFFVRPRCQRRAADGDARLVGEEGSGEEEPGSNLNVEAMWALDAVQALPPVAQGLYEDEDDLIATSIHNPLYGPGGRDGSYSYA